MGHLLRRVAVSAFGLSRLLVAVVLAFASVLQLLDDAAPPGATNLPPPPPSVAKDAILHVVGHLGAICAFQLSQNH